MLSRTPPLTGPLATLTEALDEAIREEERGRRVADLLAGYARRHDDWRAFSLTDESAYTRNLIELNDEFELLVLRWDAGQRSPVHNHEGQDCWMAVLEGPMEEAHFAFPAGPGPLDAGPVRTFQCGEVAFIRDEIGLHQVRTVGESPAASLHLYAKPYDACNCYCEVTGRVTRTPLTYDSIRGAANGAGPA